ncbi:MAG: N-acetylmuramoyl-L-alanine amidase [Cyclobacteriaceae bacterium]
MPSKQVRLFVFVSLLIHAAFSQKSGSVVRLPPSLKYSIENDQLGVTALAIKSENPIIASVTADSNFYLLDLDPDADGFTYFFSLPGPEEVKKLQINVSDSSANVYLIYSGSAPSYKEKGNIRADNPCEEAPNLILQAQWRAGLDVPNYNRSFHEVEHIIIHHSAGSNSATDYTQVVRDIYLYHTQVNGWSDIGYNYLISPDGTLYAGRDPGNGEQSFIRGAHFCGANTGTMGVCLLGNFETVAPSEESLAKLNELLTYEAIRSNFDPLGEEQHRVGLLGRIAGHQDGCATLCPGDNFYARLSQIRTEVYNSKVICEGGKQLDFAFDHEILGVGQSLTVTNESNGYRSYNWWINNKVLDIENVTFTFDVPGSYDLGLIGFNPDQIDTLIYQNAIKVSRLYQDPIVFPNPNSSRVFTIDYRPEIKEIILRDLQGRVTFKQLYENATVRLPTSIRSGIYQLELVSSEGVSKVSKLVLH